MDRPFCAIVGQPYPQRELPWPVYQTPAAVAVEAEALRRLSTVGVGQSADAALDSGKLFRGHAERPAFHHHPGCSGPSRSTKRVHMAVDRSRRLLAVRVTLGKEQERAQVRELARQVQQATCQTLKVAFADHGYTGEEPAQAALDEGIELKSSSCRRQDGLCAVARCWVVERSFGGGVRCQVSGVRCQVSGVRCQVSGVRSLVFQLATFSELRIRCTMHVWICAAG
ncbi:hypothetical protein QF002_000577 [Paraburkholderia youngii]